MSFFPSLPDDAGVRHALGLHPEAGRLLIGYHTAVLRGPSPLTEGERELIAAYVSGLNACRYCHGVHSTTARAFGVEESLLTSLVDDEGLSAAPVRLRPVLAFVRKLTLDQSRMRAADAEAVFAAGWDERALHDAINVACLFNFMNRLVHGHGILGDPGLWAERGEALRAGGYDPLLDVLSPAPEMT